MQDLLPGFAVPVLDSQRAFRAVLDAMSRPGRIQQVASALVPPAPLTPAAAAVLLTLADAETPVWLDAGPTAEAWARFHAGCPLVGMPGAAAFAFATGAPPALELLNPGTEEEPHLSATLVVQVAGLAEGAGWRLTGPGIETEHRLSVSGLPADFFEQLAANRARFPCGVDVVLCADAALVALPRTTRVEPG
jgi:alpha-D-ribose 1-methylphosphonate 5-triphosphate synthase subunit PhnH